MGTVGDKVRLTIVLQKANSVFIITQGGMAGFGLEERRIFLVLFIGAV